MKIQYMVYYLDKKHQINVAGIYPSEEGAEARLAYVKDNFGFGKGEWKIEVIPYIDINHNSILLINHKD